MLIAHFSVYRFKKKCVKTQSRRKIGFHDRTTDPLEVRVLSLNEKSRKLCLCRVRFWKRSSSRY